MNKKKKLLENKVMQPESVRFLEAS